MRMVVLTFGQSGRGGEVAPAWCDVVCLASVTAWSLDQTTGAFPRAAPLEARLGAQVMTAASPHQRDGDETCFR
jgi:hypothetical protein